MTYLTLRFVHIFFMATWMGSVLFSTGDVRRTLQEPSAHLPLLRDRMRRSTRVAGASALVTIGTGVALIFLLGGFGAVKPPIHIGLVTSLLMWGVGFGLIGRPWHQIDAALEGGAEPASQLPLVKRMAMGTGIFHLLWMVTLALMVFRNVLF